MDTEQSQKSGKKDPKDGDHDDQVVETLLEDDLLVVNNPTND